MQYPRSAPDDEFQFLYDAWPLVVLLGPQVCTAQTVPKMEEDFEQLFARRERYSLITATPRGSASMGARERKAIAEWANRPRIRATIGELCVCSSTIAKDALTRGALTAIFWLWKPACPHHVAAEYDEAVEWCLGQLMTEQLQLPLGVEGTRKQALTLLRGV